MRSSKKKRFRKAIRVNGKFNVTVQLSGNHERVKRSFSTVGERDNFITKMKSKGNYISHSSW